VTPDSRALARFWDRLERLRVEDMLARTAQPVDEAAHAAALDRAHEAAARTGLSDALGSATAGVDDWVVRLFNRSTVQPGWMEANWGRPGTVGDRANLAASLGEAATALLLGDQISAEDRDELLGAWADLAGNG
jgi:hypothetical protein